MKITRVYIPSAERRQPFRLVGLGMNDLLPRRVDTP